jgi:hypothetical protein
VDGGFAVADDYYCSDGHCAMRAYQFNDSTSKFGAGFNPGGNVVSQDSYPPIAVDPVDKSIVVLGTDWGFWHQSCPTCSQSYWTNLGFTPGGQTPVKHPAILTVPGWGEQYVFVNDGYNVVERIRYTNTGLFLSQWYTI